METTEIIKKMLHQLTEWKQLPKYQMERRADLFFGFYLKDILCNVKSKDGETYFKEDENLVVIPEFPISSSDKDLRSTNTDYMVTNGKKFYFVELKTDAASISNEKKQIEYYLDVLDMEEKAWKVLRNHINKLHARYASSNKSNEQEYKIKYNNLYRLIENYDNLKFAGVIYITPTLTPTQTEKLNQQIKEHIQKNPSKPKEDYELYTIQFPDIQQIKIEVDPVFSIFQKELTEWDKPAHELKCE